MKPLIRMILSTGSKKGFTFIEVMVAMVVLSAGIVAVYRSFFLCVDYLNNISSRWWANELVEEKVLDLTRAVQSSGGHVLTGDMTKTVMINHRPIAYQYKVDVTPLPNIEGLLRIDVNLAWHDGHRPMTTNRTVIILK